MDAEFFTTNSKLTLKNNVIWEKTLVQPPPSYWFHSFLFIIAFLAYTVYEILSGAWQELILAAVLLFWLSPHIKRIYQLLFVNVWRWYVPLSEIRNIYLEQEYNKLEEMVRLVLHSGREKTYIFLKSEQQAERFVELISSLIITVSPAAE